jgi:hypothetical protein
MSGMRSSNRSSLLSLASVALVAGGLFVVGCAAPTESPAESSETASAEVTESAVVAPAPSAPNAAAPCSGCKNQGEFALKVTGSGFSALAGKRVAVAAVEPDLGGPAASGNPAVTLSSTIDAAGGFTLSCDRALSENYGYPSYGVWIDKSGDGKCGAGDLAMVNADFYGWNSAITLATLPTGSIVDPAESWRISMAWEPAETATRWGNHPFCEYYGFPQ